MTPCDIEAAIDYAAGIVGVKTLKPQQREALLSFALGKDVFVSLPTGFGKSFCYVLLPPVFDHLRRCEETSIVLCISPLTALMMEQRAKFSLRGNLDFQNVLYNAKYHCHPYILSTTVLCDKESNRNGKCLF